MTENDSTRQDRAGQLEALHAVARLLGAHFGQRQLLQEVLTGIERELGLRRCAVMLLSPSGAERVFEASGDAAAAPGESVSYRRGEGVTGRVLATGQPAIVRRIAEEPEFRGRIHRRGSDEHHTAGFICVPITVGATVVGTLAADVPHDAVLGIEDAKNILSIVSCLIAHDVQLRREARPHYQQLEEENLRLRGELENGSEHAVPMSRDEVIHASGLPSTLRTPDKTDTASPQKLKSRVNLLERDMIVDSLKRCQGGVSRAATELGITERMIRYKIKKLGIDCRRLFPKRTPRVRTKESR